jgi:Tol biopolymer transport system component
MKLTKTAILILMLFTSLSFAFGPWTWTNRTHSEFDWKVIQTEHFNIYYYDSIESVARKGALIAEQVYQPIMDQIECKDFGKTDLVFTDEDEIMNGYAMPTNQIFIWINQNNASGWFTGGEKWLKTVVAHEFQHIVMMNVLKNWMGSIGLFGVPSWFMEGTAEYYTEKWRVGRSDSRMKIHTYKNTMDKLDPHDDGYAKVLYMADKYGDSTLTKIVHYREYFYNIGDKFHFLSKPFDFTTAFKKVTGQSLNDFNEEWRRVMNTYYYGYKAQKETIEEIGNILDIQVFQSIFSLSISPDSSMIAIIGRKSDSMYDSGLYTMTTDTNHTVSEIHFGTLTSAPSWSFDGQKITVAEYRRGDNGSLINDIRLIDIGNETKSWITDNKRAGFPQFSPSQNELLFTSHIGETTQLFIHNFDDSQVKQISNFEGDFQVQHPSWSSDGNQIAFTIQDENGLVDIATMSINGDNYKKLTSDEYEDLMPIWSHDNSEIIFTSYRNSTPNIYRISVNGGELMQMTDIDGGVYPIQIIPKSKDIMVTVLPDVDTVRVASIPGTRKIIEYPLNIREKYTNWRIKSPDIQIPQINYTTYPTMTKPKDYSALSTFRPFTWFVLPDASFFWGLGVFSDALGKHIIQGQFFQPYSTEAGGWLLAYSTAKFKPIITIVGYNHSNGHIREYENTILFESIDGMQFTASFPFNFGNSLSSNHDIIIGLALQKRYMAWLGWDELSLFDNPPQDIDETLLSLEYRWKSQRPHKSWNYHPTNGNGFRLYAEKAIPSIYGDNNNTRFEIEYFNHKAVPISDLVLYSRLKYVTLLGDNIISQDRIGLTEDQSIYLTQGIMLHKYEIYNIRGSHGNYFGDQLIFGNVELRHPLLTDLPVNIFGIHLENITGAGFIDFGRVYQENIATDLSTFGLECKFDLVWGEKLCTLSYGIGGDIESWESYMNTDDKITLSTYFRLALVSPF